MPRGRCQQRDGRCAAAVRGAGTRRRRDAAPAAGRRAALQLAAAPHGLKPLQRCRRPRPCQPARRRHHGRRARRSDARAAASARFADLDILVLERRPHPVPHAAHKVGESSVEIGAHYFDTVLGLKPHLQRRQLRKFGFRFFFTEGRRDIDQVTEIGASRYLSVPSYQIDRGIFENYLAEEAARRGVRFVDDALVRRIELAARPQRRTASAGSQDGADARPSRARWVIDACGRAGLLKRKLGLAQPNAHDANAVWFRIGDRIDIDDWSDERRMARALRPAGALAVDQPPGRRGLLGLADPAGLGLAFGRHRGRPAHASARHHRHLRQGDGLVRDLPAAPVRRAGRQARAAAGLRVLPQVLVRLQAGVLGPALGADRRGRPVPRPVLFARQRFHRASATPTSPT